MLTGLSLFPFKVKYSMFISFRKFISFFREKSSSILEKKKDSKKKKKDRKKKKKRYGIILRSGTPIFGTKWHLQTVKTQIKLRSGSKLFVIYPNIL